MTPEPTTSTEETPDTLNLALLRRMASLQLQKKEIDAKAKLVRSEIAAIQEQCRDEMMSNGVTTLPIEVESGRITLYINSTLWARPMVATEEGRAAVVEALRSEGLDDLVKTDFNVQKLSGYVRELQSNGEPVPDQLACVIETSTTVEVRGRTAR